MIDPAPPIAGFIKIAFLLFLPLFLFSSEGTAQRSYSSGELELNFMGGNEESLPFWMYRNTRGRIQQNSNFTVRISGKTGVHLTNDGLLEAGAGIFYREGRGKAILPDEAYLHYENSLFFLTVGIKQQKDIFDGLSATNENILWSLNARPLPGIQFGTSEPLYFFGNTGFGVEMFWADYLAGENLEFQEAKIHRKSLHLIYKDYNGVFFRFGLNHFVRWEENPASKEQGFRFNNYFSIITGGSGKSLPNHLGSWEIELSQRLRDYSIKFFYNSLFESFLGAKLGNFPDGRFGIFLELNDEDLLFKSFLYEFFSTKNENSNYFSGSRLEGTWAFKNDILGVPFFLFSIEEESIKWNKFSTHHIGIGGSYYSYYKTYPFRFLLSFTQYDDPSGTAASKTERKKLSFFYTTRLFNGSFYLDLQIGADYSNFSSPVYAAGISFLYRLENS